MSTRLSITAKTGESLLFQSHDLKKYIVGIMESLKGTESIFMIILSLLSRMIDIPNYCELVRYSDKSNIYLFDFLDNT